METFLSLTRFRLPFSEPVHVLFAIDGDTFEESIPVHEGGMRLRLSPESTMRLIQALQEGRQVAIFLDDFEERLDPLQFADVFAKFNRKGIFSR